MGSHQSCSMGIQLHVILVTKLGLKKSTKMNQNAQGKNLTWELVLDASTLHNMDRKCQKGNSRGKKILRKTNNVPPGFCNNCLMISDMFKFFHDHMETNFDLFWIVCLGKSLIAILNLYCTDGVCVKWKIHQWKIHPFGNEYHILNCALSKIFHMELVKNEKDWPKEEKFSQHHLKMKYPWLLLYTSTLHRLLGVLIEIVCLIMGLAVWKTSQTLKRRES